MSGTLTTAARVCRQTGWLQTRRAVLPGPSMALGVLTGTTPRQSPLVSHHTPITQCLPPLDRHKAGEQRPSLQPEHGEAHTRPRTRLVHLLCPKKSTFLPSKSKDLLENDVRRSSEPTYSESSSMAPQRKSCLGHSGEFRDPLADTHFLIALFPNVANGHAHQRV